MDRVNTVVIGAGQAGLAAAYYLKEKGVDFVVMDGSARVGDSWRNRWDSLRLFTSASMNNLPGMPFPGAKNYYPSKDEAADYLETYAAKFSFPTRLGTTVSKVAREGDQYVVTAGANRVAADNVVIASGNWAKPRTPAFAGELGGSIRQLHSSAYRNPGQLASGNTLVVGAGTSGSQIAMEVARSGKGKVYMAGRDVRRIPSKILGIFSANRLFRFITTRPIESNVGKKMKEGSRTEGAPLIGFSYKDVLASGVERVGRVTGVKEGQPRLDDDRTLEVANVVWSTGYTPDHSWIDLPIFAEDGQVKHTLGVVDGQPGVYFVGLMFQHSLSSALIYGAGRDAKHVIDELHRRGGSKAAPAPAAAAAR